MKRYDLEFETPITTIMSEHPEGYYVKYEEVKKLLTSITNFLKEDCDWSKKTRTAYAQWILKQIE
jgi:hypothetical protein